MSSALDWTPESFQPVSEKCNYLEELNWKKKSLKRMVLYSSQRCTVLFSLVNPFLKNSDKIVRRFCGFVLVFFVVVLNFCILFICLGFLIRRVVKYSMFLNPHLCINVWPTNLLRAFLSGGGWIKRPPPVPSNLNNG